MRFLRTTSLFQIRLGWLSVIAALLRDRRLGRGALEDRLLKTALAREGAVQQKWIEQAGIGSPQGKMSPRAAPDVVRMGIVYGVYDPDAEALTDLGQVLLALTAWTPDVSPFSWQGGARFIALRLLLGANGDMALEILRRWPESEQLGPSDAPAFLAKCFEGLAARAALETEQTELLNQAARATDPGFEQRVQREMVYPHLEPMLELGYLAHVKRPGEYVRTPSGRALAEATLTKTADELLVNGLSRAFLASEKIPELGSAEANDLRETVLALPSQLLGAHAEAPLEPVVLLTQARLLVEKPGCWIDVQHAATLLRGLERTSAGRIGLKAGRTPDEQNVTWRERAHLEDAKMWLPAGPDSAAPPSNGGRAVPDRDATQVHAPPPADEPATPPSSTSRANPASTKLPTAHAVLWVAYVERLLAPPALGDIGGIRRGGPLSWIATLRKLLDVPEDRLKMKRAATDAKEKSRHGGHTIATSALLRWLERLDETQGIDAAPFSECTKLWSGMSGEPMPHSDDVRGALLWAEANAERLTASLVAIIRSFVQLENPTIDWRQWEAVRAATRGIVDDALHLGMWHARELVARLAQLWERDPSTAAVELLNDLSVPAPSREFGFTQEFRVPAAMVESLDQLPVPDRTFSLEEARVEMSRSAPVDPLTPERVDSLGGSDLSVSVTLRARTDEQAISRGLEYAAEAVSRLAFLATLRMPPGSASEDGRIQPRDGGRLTDEHGMPYAPPEERDLGTQFASASDLNFSAKRPIDSPLVGAVRTLPPLAAIDRGVVLDGRARLARSLHWLALADAAVRPAEQLSHGWVAFEHLFADGEQKGHLVAELAAPVVTLCFIRAAAGRLHRDTLAALHGAACKDPAAGGVLGDLVERWLGPGTWTKYTERGPTSVVPFFALREFSDEEGLRALLERLADLPALGTVVEAHAPLVTWQLRTLTTTLATREGLRAWMFHQKRKATSFLAGVYEVRNQLVHDANPFGFDDAYRLRDLYERYRVVINPVIAEVLRLVGADPIMPLKHAWAFLRARYGELYAHQAIGEKTAPVNVDALIACLLPDLTA